MVSRYVAPAAVLLAVTAVVLGLRYIVERPASPAAPTVTRPVQARVHTKRVAPSRRYAVVQHGDSFSVIAARMHTSVARLEHLNPGVSSTALRVGQRIRVK
jgi:LysM repeat protein